jgi:hypothetical protein
MIYMRSWKSHRFTLHTWLGLNPQIERPLSRIVVQLVFFFNLFKLQQKSPDKSQHRKGLCNHDVHMLWKSQFSRPWWLRDRLWSSLDRARSHSACMRTPQDDVIWQMLSLTLDQRWGAMSFCRTTLTVCSDPTAFSDSPGIHWQEEKTSYHRRRRVRGRNWKSSIFCWQDTSL